MLITYTIDNENFPQLDVNQDLEIENFIALVSIDHPGFDRIDHSTLALIVNGKTWKIDADVLKMKLYEIGVGNNDMITIMRAQPRPAPGSVNHTPTTATSSLPGSSTGRPDISQLVRGIKIPSKSKTQPSSHQNMQDYINKMLQKTSPEAMRQVSRNLFIQMASPLVQMRYKDEYPSAIVQYKKDPTNYEAFHSAVLDDQKDYLRRIALTSDPTSPEGQAMIADMIKREAHREQLQKAMTEMPEAFIRSHMLYIKMKVNNVDCIGFVDSGAQITTISSAHAEKFKLGHKIDKTFVNVIRGVGGEQHSEGRIHSADIEVNGHIFPAPLTVLSRFGEDILIGLDTLRRHGACVDLSKNCLRLGKEGVEVPFLNEKEYADECHRLGFQCNLPPMDKEPLPESEVDSGKVAELVSLGFEATAAVKALAKAHNDIVYACDLLHDADRTRAGADSQQAETSGKPKDDEVMEQN